MSRGGLWGGGVSVELDGRLDGFTATFKLTLDDGRVWVGDITYHSERPMPLNAATARTLKDVRLGSNLLATVEQCLGRMGSDAVPWIQALGSERGRAGRRGKSPLLHAQVAAKRIEAEENAPGNATRYMRTQWPDLMGHTDRAVFGRLNRAINAGMLKKDDAGNWQLTRLAVELLSNDEETER